MCISQRTLKRWANNPTPDKRPTTAPVKQPRQLSEDEEQRILMVCNLPQYADLPASQIVPLLADKGVYIGSESTIYRVLKKHRQLTHRGKAKPRNKHPLPTSYTASEPNQVYTWDISYCPSNVKGVFWYLYLILDIYKSSAGKSMKPNPVNWQNNWLSEPCCARAAGIIRRYCIQITGHR